MKRTPFLALAALLLAAQGASHAAQMELYETGPAQDASFLRFVNGGTASMEVSASGSKARITLDDKSPASNFLPVRAGSALQGTLTSGSAKQVVSVTVQPGEFATVVGVPAADGALRAVTLREQPDDFNSLKASLGFYNLDAGCADAGLLAAGRNVAIFERVADGAVARRQINPVALSVQPSCGGKPAGQPLDLGTLQAGERYTVFLLPSTQGPRLLRAVDALAN
ncbi:DUF4397 domain-containing protein [Bordetella genomosp. 13]|uniref:DUF4397 domain-containing protein n=1 Tax=Bordetella genomosp. 13 TaxID=463040 RepID=UPI0011A55806|nr:DUF4397 domain-containing protein [Bordetella genomosp. 13]